MFGLVVIEVMTPSGHLSNINEICIYFQVFDGQGQILNNEYYFSFLAQLKGMALETYFIQQLKPEEGDNP